MENTVIDKSKNGLGLSSYKIADWARMRFSSVPNQRSARTGRRPRKLTRSSSINPLAPSDVRSPKARPNF
jgi:hypothetical protein